MGNTLVVFEAFFCPKGKTELIGGDGREIIHTVSLVDTQYLSDRAQAVSQVWVSGMVFTVFQPPMFIITFKFSISQIVYVGSLCIDNLTQQPLAGHILGSQLKEIVTAVFKHHAVKLGFFCFVN